MLIVILQNCSLSFDLFIYFLFSSPCEVSYIVVHAIRPCEGGAHLGSSPYKIQCVKRKKENYYVMYH